jgi:endonuclease/exonuclease/phosphatase family metal-dependent hydrolase
MPIQLRVATFNVENLFSRPAAMNHLNNADGQPVLDDFRRLNSLLQEPEFTGPIKQEIETLVDRYRLMDRTVTHDRMVLRAVRGKLWQQHQDGTRTWSATSSDDFLGWVELVREAIDDRAIRNTARVIAEVSADVQILVEVEDRITLQRFHDDVLVPELANLGKEPYKHVFLMDGNDPRGIDVGLLSRVKVTSMTSHVELRNAQGHPLFARDCAQFAIELGQGQSLIIFANHFSSQGSDKTGKRRREQANKVRLFVDDALNASPLVIVAGDLNEPPAKGNLNKLLHDPDLKDAMAMDQYPDKATLPGTYLTAAKSHKLDYLFLSTALQGKVQTVGVERRGFKSTKWPHFDTVVDARSQASDHHCLWVDLNM